MPLHGPKSMTMMSTIYPTCTDIALKNPRVYWNALIRFLSNGPAVPRDASFVLLAITSHFWDVFWTSRFGIVSVSKFLTNFYIF